MYVLLNDTHIGKKGFCPVVSSYMLNYHVTKVLPFVLENKITKIIHLGDVFDNREKMDIDILRQWRRGWFDLLNEHNIQMDVICGNHDTYYKNTNSVSSVEEFLEAYKNITIYTEPTIVDSDEMSSLYLPWITPENQERSFSKIKEASTLGIKYVFGHLEVIGFKMNSGINSEHGMDRKTFKPFKRVMTGHFHSRSTQNNIFYLGSQYHMDWGDYGEVRGFHTFDPANNELTLIDNDTSLFAKIEYKDGMKISSMDLQGKIVKVVVEEKTDIKKYDKFIEDLNKLNPHSLAIIENILDDSNTGEVSVEAKDTLSIIYDYIDLLEGVTDKKILKELFANLYSDAIEKMRSA